MTLPNFLVIGAAKSGTTSLYRYLKQHPQVYMSPVKEPHFFTHEGERPNFRGPGDEWMNTTFVYRLGDYRKLFAGVSDEKAIGEASTWYLGNPKAPDRIRHYIPEAKLIAILRNPVDRAYSAYLHLVRIGQEWLDFARALREEEARIKANWNGIWHYKRGGFYYLRLKRYYDTFGREQIRVYLYEDLKEDPVGTTQSIFRFLEVDDAFVPDTSHKLNVSSIPRSRVLQAFVRKPNPLKGALKPFVPKGLRRRVMTNLHDRNLTKPPPMPEDIRGELTEAYREDVLRLQELTGRDLSKWLEVSSP
jgi:hypothetical protein